jgi:hypothetical protein
MSHQAFYDPDLTDELLPEPSIPHYAEHHDEEGDEQPSYQAYVNEHGLVGEEVGEDAEEEEKARREALESVPEDVKKVSMPKTARILQSCR